MKTIRGSGTRTFISTVWTVEAQLVKTVTMEYSKLPAEERERRARVRLFENRAPQSTLVNNLLNERFASRRRKVRQVDDDQTIRRNKQRYRLLQKLALKRMIAHKENLEKEQNESEATQENAKDPRGRKSKKKGQPRKKTSSTTKKMRPKDKKCRTARKKSTPARK